MRASIGLVAGAIIAATAAFAQVRPSAESMSAAGGYLLAADEGARRCMLLLRAVPVEGGLALGFPAHCRITLPILNTASAWSVESSPVPLRGRIRFHDATGRTLVDFNREGPNEGLAGKDEAGTTYSLAPGDGRSLAVRLDGRAAARSRQVAAQPVGPRVEPLPSDTGMMARLVGGYELMRAKDRATGCRLTLTQLAGKTAPVSLEPGCSDKGVMVFAPASWSLSGGTLWLLNARGQKLSFERNRQGHWDKSAGQGEPLSLIRQ